MRALLLIVSACAYDASYGDCAILCAADSSCPEGLACGGEGLCRAPGVAATCGEILGDAGTGPSFLSCVDLPTTCGPTGTSDCCESPLVTGGTFYRSYDVSSDGMYSSTSYPATVSDFRLDKYEVTVGRFRKFVEAGQGTQAHPPTAGSGSHARIQGSGWDASWTSDLAADTAALIAAVKCDATHQTWTDVAGTNESLPMNCLTWYEAMAFCIWDGGYPPTEAEWNYAAVGGDEQRAYPWSSPPGSTAIDCSYANYDSTSTYCVNPTSGGDVNRVGSESPRGDGRWGQVDLGGNVWEWTLDWSASPYATPCSDCTDLTPSPYKTIRGGDFYFDASYVRAGYRLPAPPEHRDIGLGVRCARSVP